jgi:hypothetical protein
MFHVSQLKKHIGIKEIPQHNLPLVTSDGYIEIDPIVVLDTIALPRRNEVVTQWKIYWQNLFGRINHSPGPPFMNSTSRLWSNCGHHLILVVKDHLKHGGVVTTRLRRQPALNPEEGGHMKMEGWDGPTPLRGYGRLRMLVDLPFWLITAWQLLYYNNL